MPYTEDFHSVLQKGTSWLGMGDNARCRRLLDEVFAERFGAPVQQLGFQVRASMQPGSPWAGYVHDRDANAGPGPWAGLGLIWMAGEGGSVLGVCTGVLGAAEDDALLYRPGYRRAYEAVGKRFPGVVWVRTDPRQINVRPPSSVLAGWPSCGALLEVAPRLIAGLQVTPDTPFEATADFLDLFFDDAGLGELERSGLVAELFPAVDVDEALGLLETCGVVVLEGASGTGKQTLANQLAERAEGATVLRGATAVELHATADKGRVVAIDPVGLTPASYRRFAILRCWPQRSVVEEQGIDVALECFDDTLRTFVEFGSVEQAPGHGWFLGADVEAVKRSLRVHLVPWLRAQHRLGALPAAMLGLAERLEDRAR